MRKCQACGYLLLGVGDKCNHCGAELPRVAAPALVTTGATPLATGGVAPSAPPPVPPVPPPAPRFGPSVVPPPPPAPVAYGMPAPAAYGMPAPDPTGVMPPYPPPASAPGRAPVEREYWSPSTMPTGPVTTKSATGIPRALLVLVMVLSMASGWVLVDRVFQHQSLPPGTSAFVAGHGVPYSSPDRTFDARFPSTPTVERKVIPVASSSATINLAQVQTDDYEVVAASLVLPVPVPPDRIDTVLHDILLEGTIATDQKITSEKKVVRDGATGLEVRAAVSDGYDSRMIVLSSGTHLYLLGVHSKRATAKLYQALLNSLIMY